MQTDLQPMPFGIGLKGLALEGNQQTDDFVGRNTVDILWVMDTDDDDSERDFIAQNASTIIEGLTQLGIDFQMGVTSTDFGCGTESRNWVWGERPGLALSGVQDKMAVSRRF